MLGIYEIAELVPVWDIPNMATRLDKKESARRSALAIAARLAEMPHQVSERQWTIDAKVSPSFFSNLRGTPTKPPSDPSVDQLRQVLKVRNVTLAEFFVPEAEGRVVPVKSREDVERAFADALREMPPKAADRPRYLATVVGDLLGLPASLPATQGAEDPSASDGREEAAPPRRATKQK